MLPEKWEINFWKERDKNEEINGTEVPSFKLPNYSSKIQKHTIILNK